jgi:hypothetical protein
MQKLEYSFGKLGTYPVHTLYLRDRRLSKPVNRAEFFQQRLLAVLADARTIVQNAFRYSLLHEKLMIDICESMRLIADPLEELQSSGIIGQPDWHWSTGPLDLLKFF